MADYPRTLMGLERQFSTEDVRCEYLLQLGLVWRIRKWALSAIKTLFKAAPAPVISVYSIRQTEPSGFR